MDARTTVGWVLLVVFAELAAFASSAPQSSPPLTGDGMPPSAPVRGAVRTVGRADLAQRSHRAHSGPVYGKR